MPSNTSTIAFCCTDAENFFGEWIKRDFSWFISLMIDCDLTQDELVPIMLYKFDLTLQFVSPIRKAIEKSPTSTRDATNSGERSFG